jgi:3',5'-cyclic AMP phosphodiesterase CpdA
MRTLAHLSDLHFGRVDAALLQPLSELLRALAPDALVISGDLTQRARKSEFQAARAYLDTLPAPQIVVPGNHDIPLYNLFSRFVRPLKNYRRYISAELCPVYADDEIFVTGLNTARSLTFKDGRISHEQIERIRAQLSRVDKKLTKIVVTHHPFDLPAHFHRDELVGRAAQGMSLFSECGVDLLLAGHMHVSTSINSASRYKIHDYSSLAVQAGTATSVRRRDETNSFNLLRIAPSEVHVERYGWAPEQGQFLKADRQDFVRDASGWISAGAPELNDLLIVGAQ